MPSRYGHAHQSTNGPRDSRPTALQIIQDEDRIGSLAGKVLLVTGCSSGIGVETAKALAATGAMLYLTARDVQKAEAALASILRPGHAELIEMDLGSLAGAKAGAELFLAKDTSLNVLVCNAGVPGLTRTPDGFETHFAVNHLAHFLLFHLVKHKLLVSASPSFNSRVVMVSSSGHRGGGIRRNGDYNYHERPEDYDAWGAYAQSKTANIYMANEIERRYAAHGLHALSVMPGAVSSGIQRHLPLEESSEFASANQKIMKSPGQGAATSVLAAIGRDLEGRGGLYLENCEVAGLYPDDREYDHIPDKAGYSAHAFDQELERQLWGDCLELCREFVN